MGVYIPDMKLPSSCLACDIPVRVQPCPVDHDNVSNYKSSRHPACPLIHVPPHGRLIDADALYSHIKDEQRKCNDPYDGWSECQVALGFVNSAPTIIPAEEDESDG